GAPAVNVSVRLDAPAFQRSTQTDTGGRYLFTDVPVGRFSLRAAEPRTTVETTVQVVVVQDQTTPQDVAVVAVGSVFVQVNFADGRPAANAQVNIRDARNNFFRFAGLTGPTGSVSIADVAAGPFTVQSLDPRNNGSSKDVTATLV